MMTVRGKMKDSSFQTLLRTLCKERFWLYDLYKEGKMNREEYMEKIQPIDAAVDDLELSLIRDGRFCQKPV